MVERPGPAHVSAPWASYGATQLALTGILSALHERERSGLGQRVDTSLVQGVAGQGPYNWFLRVIADRYPDAFNFTPPFSDNGVPNDGVFFMLLIALTKDGRWMQFAQVQPHLFRAFMEKVDLAWMYDDPAWQSIPRFDTEEQRSEFWDILLGKVRERTFDEWQQVFDADHNVWAEIFRRGSELLDHPQITHLGAAVELDDPQLRPGAPTRPAGADERDAGSRSARRRRRSTNTARRCGRTRGRRERRHAGDAARPTRPARARGRHRARARSRSTQRPTGRPSWPTSARRS